MSAEHDEAAEVAEVIAALGPNPAPEEVYEATDHYSTRAVSAAAATFGTGEGASTLAGLSDVTGEGGPGKSPVGETGSTDYPLTRVVTQEDLDAILASVARVEWHDLTLQPGFTNAGQGHAPARYRLTLNNVVYLEGRINHTPPLTVQNAGKPIAQLPLETVPGYLLTYLVAGDGQSRSAVTVDANGLVAFAGFLSGTGQTNWLSLAAIIFSTAGDTSAVIDAAFSSQFGGG